MSIQRNLQELQERRRPANRNSLYCTFICLVAAATFATCNSIFAYIVASEAEKKLTHGLLAAVQVISGQKDLTDSQQVSSISVQEASVGAVAFDVEPFAQNRSIVLIHVGKAGGLTIRENLAHTCNYISFGGTPKKQAKRLQRCKDRLNKHGGLSLQTQSVFHGTDYNGTAVQEATTFVFTLRNPIDRIVSAYRFSHPKNCIESNSKQVEPNNLMRGCQLIKAGIVDQMGGYKIFTRCFPSPAIEEFAQILMNPYNASDRMRQNAIKHIRECHRIARDLVQGKPMFDIIPHMQYNYEYYASNTVLKYPDKEVFGIRTEHQFDDMEQVDKWVGGKGEAWNRGNPFSHGSENFAPSPLSTEATTKLCCALFDEIEAYLDLFDRAVNLDAVAKREAEEKLRNQCGLSNDASWLEWEATCRIRLNQTIEMSLNTLPREIFYPQQTEVSQNRSIVFVHVGKAGGTTLRRALSIPCATGQLTEFNDVKEQRHWCSRKYELGQRLSLQTRSVFHVDDYDHVDMEEATTYVVTLRNPIDRVISAYRFSHPENCKNDTDVYMRGCIVIRNGHLDNPTDMAYILYKDCFPSAAMEDFAQSMMPPWRPSQHFSNLTDGQVNECRRFARQLVDDSAVEATVPQMHFNYLHYWSGSVGRFPDKEVFGVRTEHEWEDIVAIDKLIGGSGNYPSEGRQHTHGSENYLPSPLSQEAYGKLCCVLASEIKIYFKFIDLSLNLDAAAKLESETKLRKKCGIPASTSWKEWRYACHERLAQVDQDGKKNKAATLPQLRWRGRLKKVSAQTAEATQNESVGTGNPTE